MLWRVQVHVQVQVQAFFSYLLSELVDAGIADPLSRSWTVQPEGTLQTGLSPGGGDGVFDSVEDRRGQKERRLAHGLKRQTLIHSGDEKHLRGGQHL